MKDLSGGMDRFDGRFARALHGRARRALLGPTLLGPTLLGPTFLGAALLGAAPTIASAQTASQLTPPSFRPSTENPATAAPLAPGEGAPAPEGADRLFVTLAGVDIEGAFDVMDAAGRVAARLTGRRVSGADIFAAAGALEAAYARAGFVLVRVVLPPQTLADGGRLRLVVVDGFIERVEAQGVPERVRARVEAVLAPLVERRGLTLAEIERRVLIAGDAPGLQLRSTLAPGAGQGAAILVVDGAQQPVGGLVTLDNTLATRLGPWTLGLGLDLNSPFSQGEQIYLRLSGDPKPGTAGFLDDYPRNRVFAAGFVAPLGVDGLSFNLEGVMARTNPVPTDGFARVDVFSRLAARLRDPVVRSRAANLSFELAFDAADDQQSLVVGSQSFPLAHDRSRVLRLSVDGDYEPPWGGALAGRATASFGLDGLGARTAPEPSSLLPLSRQFANASFSKIEGQITYSRVLADHLAASAVARAQTSFGEALILSEQFGIANLNALSSFDAGTLQGDCGASLRAELSSPWSFALPQNFMLAAAPYAFGAIGEVNLSRPTIVEPKRLRAASFGLGLRLSGAEKGGFSSVLVGLEWGRSIRNAPDFGLDRLTDQKFTLSATLKL